MNGDEIVARRIVSEINKVSYRLQGTIESVSRFLDGQVPVPLRS